MQKIIEERRYKWRTLHSMTKRAIIAALALLALCAPSFATEKKPCTDASATEAPGSWKPHREKDVDIEESSIIPKSEWPALKKQMDVYADILHGALGEARGYEAIWYRSVGGAIFNGGPAKTLLTAPLFRYYCENGALELSDEYIDVASIQANGTWHMSGPEAGYIVGGKKAYRFGTPIGEIRGFPVFEADWHQGAGPIQISWVVIVSRPGKFPFTYISRKELLDELRARNEAERAKGLKTADSINPIRPQAVQDKDREKELALFLKGAKDEQQRRKWTERFNKDYRTDEQKRDDARKKYTGIYDKIRARLDAVEARYTPQQLSEPALAGFSETNFSADDKFDFKPAKQDVCGKSTSCGEHHGHPLAVPDKGYFNPALPKSAPQFFAVTIAWGNHTTKRDGKWVVEDPKWEKIRDEFFARIDFDKLVSLLGK